jgi:hypothetical protein
MEAMSANCLNCRAETWPGKRVHGSVAVSLETVFAAPDSSKQP